MPTLKIIFPLAVIATLGYLYYKKNEFSTRRTLIMGVLLILLGMMHTMVWNVGYMVVGMGLVAISGAFLVFGNGIGKLLYLLGLLLIGFMSIKEFGMSSEVYTRTGLLVVIGIFVMFLDENQVDNNLYNKEAITDGKRVKHQGEYAKYARNSEEATDWNGNIRKIRLVALGVFLAMAVYMAIYVMFK